MDSGNKIPVKPALYDQVMTVIKKRTKLNPVKSAEVEMRFQIGGGRIRDIVQYARFIERIPIASGPDGYFLARNWKEWKATVSHYKGRTFTMLSHFKIIDGMFTKQESLFGN